MALWPAPPRVVVFDLSINTMKSEESDVASYDRAMLR